MKRAFPQKVKSVSSHLIINSVEGESKQVNPGARRARTSAAMIGLALSMGAANLFLPRQSDRAAAAEPKTAEPTLTAIPLAQQDVALPSASEIEIATVAPVPAVVEHTVQEGETLWELAHTHRADIEAIVTSNGLAPDSVLQIGQVLAIPVASKTPRSSVVGGSVRIPTGSDDVSSAKLSWASPRSGASQARVGGPIAGPEDIDSLLKAEQDNALNRLRQKQARLRSSLAELRSEESRIAVSLVESSSVLSGQSEVATPQEAEIAYQAPADGVDLEGIAIPELQKVEVPQLEGAPEEASQAPGVSQVEVVATAPTVEVITTTPTAVETTVEPSNTVVSESESNSGSAETPAADLQVEVTGQELPEASQPEASVQIKEPSDALQPQVSVQVPQSPMLPQSSQAVASVSGVSPELPTPASASVELPSVVLQSRVAEPTVPQLERAESVSSVVYQVNSGDTLDAIARRYGVTRAELVAANGLFDPNFIVVNQEIKIPQRQAVVQRSRLGQAIASSESSANVPVIVASSNLSGQVVPETTVPNITVPTQPSEVTVPTIPALTVGTGGAMTVASVPPAEGTTFAPLGVDSEQASNSTQVAARLRPSPAGTTEPQQAPEVTAAPNPYVENLLTEIMSLREKYRADNTGATASSQTGTVEQTANVEVEVALNTPSASSNPSRHINPEFSPNQYVEALQQEIRGIQDRQAERAQARANLAPVATQPETEQRLVAAAPLGSETYEPIIRPMTGRMVSPDLPPLGRAESYLPEGSSAVNGYIWPSRGTLTSGYGWRWGRMHRGIDIAAPVGTPVVAAAPGVVVTSGWNSGGYGNLVEIRHSDGSLTLYAHNSRLLVRVGQQVEQGQQIAEMGSTGYSTGPHVHFEVHLPGQGTVNPIAYLASR